MIKKIKSLIFSKNENALAFFNILGPIVLNGINFFTVPVFTRMLGTENFGIVSIYTAWVQVFTIFMGIQTYGTIAVSKTYFEEKEINSYYSSILSLSCLSSAIIITLSLIFINPISKFMGMSKFIVLLMLLQSFGTYCVSFATYKYTYSKQASKNFAVSVIVALFSVALSLIIIINTKEFSQRYIGRIMGYAIPNIVVGLFLAALIIIKGKKAYSAKYWKFCLPLCLPLIFHNLSQIVLAQSDRVMIQKLLTDNSAVGIYSFIFTFVHILNIIWAALNNTWLPFYYEHVKNDEREKIRSKSKNYIILYTVVSIGFILLSPEVIKLFSSEEFWSGTYLVPIMSFAYYMVFLYSFPVNFEFYHRKTSIIAAGTCGAALINILLNYFLIPLFGITGAAVATTAAYTMLFVFHQIIAKYIVKNNYNYKLKHFLPGIIAMLAASAVFYAAFDFWYIRWAVGALLGLGLVIRIYKNKGIF